MKRTLVLIDDDTVGLDFYITELRVIGFDAQLVSEPAGIRALIDGTSTLRADFFIVDLMMPTHELYPDEEPILSSWRAGLMVARDLRARYATTPILVWSNISHSDLLENATRHSTDMPLCLFASKWDISPRDLQQIITHYFESGELRLPDRPPGFFKRLWRAITLRPGVAGVSVDLKKLTKGGE